MNVWGGLIQVSIAPNILATVIPEDAKTIVTSRLATDNKRDVIDYMVKYWWVPKETRIVNSDSLSQKIQK